MEQEIIKRDGRVVAMEPARIVEAIYKACQASGMTDNEAHTVGVQVGEKVLGKVGKLGEKVSVDQVQGLVETTLMQSKYKTVATKYIEYRSERDKARELQEDLFKDVDELISRKEGGDILTENANRDSRIIPTIKSLVAESIGKHYAKKYILPRSVSEAHAKGEIHFHDAGELLYPMFNCMLIDLRTMLKYGFAMGNATVETPKSILTACSIAAQVVTAVGSHIYGGNTLPELDITLEPYVKKSFDKHMLDATAFGIKNRKAYAKKMTERDTKDGIQALYYQLNTIISTQGQTVFCTLTCGEGTSWEARLVQKCILEQQLAGLGKDKTTFVFPKLVFQVRKGVNFYEEDPNYDMFKLAAKCSAKRLYPDILFMDTLEEKQHTQALPMGCLDGAECVTYMYNGERFVTPFEVFWEHMKLHYPVLNQGVSEYIDLSDKPVLIADNDGFVQVKKILKNPDMGNWYKLKFLGGRDIIATADHPLPVEGKGRTFVEDMELGDEVAKVVPVQHTGDVVDVYTTDEAYVLGLMICDGCYHNSSIAISLDHRTEQDIIDKLIPILKTMYPNHTVRAKLQDRGVKGVYTEVLVSGKGITEEGSKLAKLFGGFNKVDRTIPSVIFNSSVEVKEAFLGGMMDADGYIRRNDKRTEISIGTTNRALSLMQLELFNDLGLRANHRINENYNGNGGKSYITFLNIEAPTPSKDSIQRSFTYAKLSKKEFLGSTGRPSFDVETISDTFNVSGIHSHNCRSFLAPWKNEKGETIYHGRNNLGVVSVNLVRVGIESKGDTDKFWRLLDERCELAHEGLKARIKRLENVKASVAPILYCSGAMGVKLKPDANVIEIMKNGRASISLGWLGMHEAIYALFGEDVRGKHENFALDVTKFLKHKVEQWTEDEGYGYSLYNTPAENLCYRFCKLDEEQFGVIENVTTKGYYTNSCHRTVEDPLNVFEKATFEEPYMEYTNGGFISYGEYPSMIGHEDELISAWKEISNHQSYYGTNLPSDQCFKCGYEGEFTAKDDHFECPVCGNHDEESISVIRRVCGYLSSTGSRPVNKGKHKEMQHRVKHW